MTTFKTIVPGCIYCENKHMLFFIWKDDYYIKKLKETIPFLVYKVINGRHICMLPCTSDLVRLFYNIGLPIRGIEPYRLFFETPLVEGRYIPMRHQIDTAAFCSVFERAYVTSTMRTGKTFSMVACMAYLQSQKALGAGLIVATVSNLTGVWKHTIESTLPNKRVVVVHGGVGRKARLAQLDIAADFYIINYDGVKMVADRLRTMVADNRIGMVVVDELTHYGNTSSGRWKALNSVINGKKPARYVWGLTGSPGMNPIPVFGFCKLINPKALPCDKLHTWRDMTQYKYGRESWQWRNKSTCSDTIYAAMQPNIRFDKADIMDLPPVVKQRRDCDLSKEQLTAYERIRTDMIVQLANGAVIEAVHKASVMGKLFQIAQGTVIVSGKETANLDNKSRLNTILECIDEAFGKVVIFCAYTGVLDRLAEQLRDAKQTVEVVDGRITGKKRAQIFDAFQHKKDPHILVCHPQTTAFGVELAAADTMIFNGPPMSGEFIYAQALERLSSLKQEASQVRIIQIAATSEERHFFAGLDSGIKNSTLINDMFAEFTRSKKFCGKS